MVSVAVCTMLDSGVADAVSRVTPGDDEVHLMPVFCPGMSP